VILDALPQEHCQVLSRTRCVNKKKKKSGLGHFLNKDRMRISHARVSDRPNSLMLYMNDCVCVLLLPGCGVKVGDIDILIELFTMSKAKKKGQNKC
jgi:hypothetical protein